MPDGGTTNLMTHASIIWRYTVFIQKQSFFHCLSVPTLERGQRRLKLVIGVEISRREVKRSGSDVCAKRRRRRRNAETRTRVRRFERRELGEAIA